MRQAHVFQPGNNFESHLLDVNTPVLFRQTPRFFNCDPEFPISSSDCVKELSGRCLLIQLWVSRNEKTTIRKQTCVIVVIMSRVTPLTEGGTMRRTRSQ